MRFHRHLKPFEGSGSGTAYPDELLDGSIDPVSVMSMLQQVQYEHGYLSQESLERISAESGVHLSRLYGVATFYSQFRLKPAGRYVVHICHGTACHVNGAQQVQEAVIDELGIDDGGTTEDGLFTLEKVACLGACILAPVITVDNKVYGHLDADAARRVISHYRNMGVVSDDSR